MAWTRVRVEQAPITSPPFHHLSTTSRSVTPGRTALGNSTTKYGWECTSGRGKVLLIPGGEAQACVYWFFDLSSLKFEWNNKNIYKSVQRVFCRKPKAFHVCTLGTFIQELFYLPLKKNHPKIFQMKTSKTLKSYMKNWCQCDFPRNPLLFTVWSPVQCFLPIWQLSLKQMATSWEGSLCVSPPGLIGAPGWADLIPQAGWPSSMLVCHHPKASWGLFLMNLGCP